MAQNVIIQLVDDLDGTIGDDIETVAFSLDGVDYEIELNEANAAELRRRLAPFTSAARRIGGRAKPGTRGSNSANVDRTGEQAQAIRDWARRNGHHVLKRGRIPVLIARSFEAAHTDGATGIG